MVKPEVILVLISPAYLQVFLEVFFLLKYSLSIIPSADDVIRHG
jgi:hypothetical protein